MKYMLLVYLEEKVLSDSEREECYVKSAKLAQDLHSGGKYLDASPLHPIATATSIRVREGKRLVTDGPFAESKEVVGGYFVVLAKNLNEAVEIAKDCPDYGLNGIVEVREVMKFDNM